MKQLFTFLSILFSVPLLFAQEIETLVVPDAVIDRFTLLYPDARSIEWQIIKENYKADFKNDKATTMALIAWDGVVLKTETEIKTTALPETAIDYLTQNYPEKKIEQASIIEDKDGIITFEAVLDKVDLTFDSAGQVLATTEVVAGPRG
jgi:hypothetical protein